MAKLAALHSSCFFTHKPHLLLYKPLHFTPTKPKFTITSQDSSSSPPSQSSKPTITNDTNPSDKKPNSSTGQGFGSAQLPNAAAATSSSKKKGKKEGRTIIRRSPVQRPPFLDKKGGDDITNSEDQSVGERAFLLAWLSLGGLIFVEGIALSISGFLPEEWDKFFVKFVYPSFTPTVFLFVGCSVAYGVYKYFQNEDVRDQK